MPITLNGDTGITTPSYGGTDAAEYLVPVTAFKNRIINGAMQIDQRNAGASVTPTGGATYTLDRWQTPHSQNSKFSVQQNASSVTPPAGFNTYLGITSLSAYSILSTDFFALQQTIEGFNVADMNWGTANASDFTVSFWVRSSLTGTFGGAARGFDGVSNIRAYPFTYTISASNTWEYKTVTIPGDKTASAAWTSTQSVTNGFGMILSFGLGIGSTFSGTAGSWQADNFISATGATSVVGTSGATFYITGVQLEKGSNATSFDYRPYGTELALCQRYYEPLFGYVPIMTGTEVGGTIYYKVDKRAAGTVTLTRVTGTNTNSPATFVPSVRSVGWFVSGNGWIEIAGNVNSEL
jgi:hypothetical protein